MKGVLNARLFYIRDDICIVILIPEFALHAFFLWTDSFNMQEHNNEFAE